MQSAIKEELITGTEVSSQLVELRSRQLQQAAQILCQDFGFREAISSRDKATIESMLSNHSKSANARSPILNDLEQTIIATSPITITLDSKFTSQIATNISAAQGNLNFIPLNLSNPQSLQSKYAETAKFSKFTN